MRGYRPIPAPAEDKKYGHDIGKAAADIPRGGHAHVHNVKTKRW